MLKMISGAIKDYNIFTYQKSSGTYVTIYKAGNTEPVVEQHEVPNYGTDLFELMSRPSAAVGWASFGEGEMEVIYFYDKADDNFGYAINVTDEMLSEWGYAAF